MNTHNYKLFPKAFTLVEVVLAIAVMSLAVVALLGLLVPTLSSVRSVIDTSEATAAMSKFNAYIDNQETFDAVLARVNAQNSYWVYEVLRDGGGTEIKTTANVGEVNTDYGNRQIVGPVFRFLLRRSSIWPDSKWDPGDAAPDGINKQAYFPIFVRVLMAEPDEGAFSINTDEDYVERFKILSYTTAKLR